MLTGSPFHQAFSIKADNVFQQASEHEIVERSIHPLISSCVEGVSVCVLSVSSAKAGKTRTLFTPIEQQSLAASIFQALASDLESKAKRLADANASLQPSPSSGALLPLVDSASAAPVGLRYSLRLSFAEIYEESITVRSHSSLADPPSRESKPITARPGSLGANSPSSRQRQHSSRTHNFVDTDPSTASSSRRDNSCADALATCRDGLSIQPTR